MVNKVAVRDEVRTRCVWRAERSSRESGVGLTPVGTAAARRTGSREQGY